MTATIVLDKHFTKAMQKLDRSVYAKVMDFVGKLQQNPDAPGLKLKSPQGVTDNRVMTARVNDFWRAVLFDLGERKNFLFVAVKRHDEAYDYAGRLRLDVNPVHGALEIYEDTFDGASLRPEPRPRPDEPSATAGEQLSGSLPAEPDPVIEPVLAGRTGEELLGLGIAARFLDDALRIADPLEFELFCETVPMVQGYVLLDLQAGRPVEDIHQDLLADSGLTGEADEIDRDDVAAAVKRPLSQLQFASGTSEELLAAMEGDMAAWRVWLHPTQRSLAYHDGWNGPFRVTGGAGTGKTVTALHRARHLADRARARGAGEKVLVATFTKNLAAELRAQLVELAGEHVLDTVEVTNLDALAGQLLTRSGGPRPRLHGDDAQQVRQGWDVALAGDADWTPEFLHAEWLHVVLAQGITDRRGYFRARRLGRGIPLNRAKRARVWELIEKFQQNLRAEGIRTFTQANAVAAEQVALSGPLYRHAVVDEAQDLHPAHWRLLRAVTEAGTDDLFLVGDAHQRIYGRRLVLSHYGIHTRGRSRRLTVNYRTSAEIMQWCVAVMSGADVDDLEGESDTLVGARSEFHGEPPRMIRCSDAGDEVRELAELVRGWREDIAGLAWGDIGVLTNTHGNVREAADALREAGVPVVIVERPEEGGTGSGDGVDRVQVMTMHRAKGLEFRCVAITRLGAGVFPGQLRGSLSAEDRDQAEARQRSLLYVAASRARERLALLYSGEPSPLLPRAR